MERRNVLAIPALAAAIAPAATAAMRGHPKPPRRIIATEEGFALPETLAATGAWLAQNPTAEPGYRALRASFGPAQAQQWFAELVDLGEVREGVMRDAGITTQLLLLNSPGVQIFDAAQGTALAALVNDRMADYGLVGPIWGFAADTGLHALRLIIAGVFDRFPGPQLVLGHLGEGLAFFIDRVDIRYRVDGSPMRTALERLPSDYLKANFHLTTDGMNWEPAVRQSIDVMGADRVLFAADWPFEDAVDATHRFLAMNLSEAERDKLAYRNAERLFRIAPL